MHMILSRLSRELHQLAGDAEAALLSPAILGLPLDLAMNCSIVDPLDLRDSGKKREREREITRGTMPGQPPQVNYQPRTQLSFFESTLPSGAFLFPPQVPERTWTVSRSRWRGDYS